VEEGGGDDSEKNRREAGRFSGEREKNHFHYGCQKEIFGTVRDSRRSEKFDLVTNEIQERKVMPDREE